MISGFTFVHDALAGGYPIKEAIQAVQPYVDEIVAVDMESTDGTRELLKRLECRVIDGKWGNQAGETLKAAYRKYQQCDGDTIIHFEADEVYDDRLIKQIRKKLDDGFEDLAVYRLQLEQNFQRCRWYPDPVHRVFGKWSDTVKAGHTTNRYQVAAVIGPEYGYLWDITNCFRDHWLQRVENQAELWHGKPTYLMTPLHTLHESMLDGVKARGKLTERHWTWKETPFKIPEILRHLVGQTMYRPSGDY